MDNSLLKHLFPARLLPRWSILFLDLAMVGGAVLLAYLFRYDFSLDFTESRTLKHTVVLALLANLLVFLLFRSYANVLRYSSFVDILRIFVVLSLSYGIILVCGLFGFPLLGWHVPPKSILLMSYVLNFSLMALSRVGIKIMYETLTFDSKHSQLTMIYGAKKAGCSIAKALRASLSNRFQLCGFIADESDLVGKTLMNLKVYANDGHLSEVLERKGVKRIIISPAKMEEVRETDFLDRMLSLGIKVMYVPPLDEWKKDVDLHNQIRKIRIEDLLEREPIQIDMRKIASHIEGKRVLITGAAGSIGSEIMRQVAGFNPYQLVLVDQAETPLHDIRLELLDHWKEVEAKTIVADIGNPSRMEDIFRTYRPQYIFHAAAYKHVPMMEDNVSESIQTNVAGTMILADLAVKYGAEKFVMVSTDKAVNPTNVMGCSKRICEIYVQSLAKKLQREGAVSPRFITTRFGNVLGSNGSVIPRFREQIEHGGPVTVTHPEIIRYFMTIPEACRLVLEAGSMGHGGEIYIFDMGKPVKILDLAKKMINLSGHPEIKIEFTGLRHGEKLYEELLNVKEQTQPTYHEKIMIASVREYDYDDVKERIARLVETSYGYDDMETVRAMKALVPEFISKNSCFERLDPPVSAS